MQLGEGSQHHHKRPWLHAGYDAWQVCKQRLQQQRPVLLRVPLLMLQQWLVLRQPLLVVQAAPLMLLLLW